MSATPKAVLDAGRRERERYELAGTLHRDRGFDPPYGPWGVVEKVGETYLIHLKEIPARSECQDFIDDRVFRAMLRALATHFAERGHADAEVELLLSLAGTDHD